MASCGFTAFVVVMLTLVVSLGLLITAILTDNWFQVETTGVVADTYKRENTYNFGFWRRCYDAVPESIPSSDLGGPDNDCITIYEDLIEKSDANITSDEELVMHLSRSYIGLAITSGAIQLATLIILICGSWPGECNKIQKPTLYVCASLVLLIATMAGIAAGVCFIAARDVEDKDMFKYRGLDTEYGWSFMLHWISTGLCLIDGFLILCLVKFSYKEVNDNSKLFYYQS